MKRLAPLITLLLAAIVVAARPLPPAVTQAIQSAAVPAMRQAGVTGQIKVTVDGYDPVTVNGPTSLPAAPAYPVAPRNQTITTYVSPTGVDTADGKTPATAGKTVPARPASGTILLLQRGGTYVTSGIYFNGRTDITVDAYGDSAKPAPVVYGTSGANVFSWWTDTARVIIQNVDVDSAYKPAVTAGGYVYRQPTAAFGNVKGTDTLIRSVGLRNLAEGPQLADVTRSAVVNCTQIEPLGMPSRCVMISNARDVTITGNRFVNSVNEIPIRSSRVGDGGGIVNGLIEGNYVSQLLDADHGRAAAKGGIAIRQADRCMLRSNTLVDCDLSIEQDSDGKGSVTNTTIDGGTITGVGKLNVRLGVSGLTVSGLTINTTLGVGVTDQSGAAGNTYTGLTVTSSTAAIDFGVLGSNAVVSGVQSTAAGVPVVKGAFVGTDGGANMVAGVASQIGGK